LLANPSDPNCLQLLTLRPRPGYRQAATPGAEPAALQLPQAPGNAQVYGQAPFLSPKGTALTPCRRFQNPEVPQATGILISRLSYLAWPPSSSQFFPTWDLIHLVNNKQLLGLVSSVSYFCLVFTCIITYRSSCLLQGTSSLFNAATAGSKAGGRLNAMGDGEAGAAAIRDQTPTSGNDWKAGGDMGFAGAADPDYYLKYKWRDDQLLAWDFDQ